MKWFKHDTTMLQNRKIKKLIRVHGATGYAFWCALLEKLYGAEDKFEIHCDDLWFEDIAEELRLGDYRTPIRILDTLADLNLIDKQMWEEHVIYAPAIVERGDQYLARRLQEREKKRKQRAAKAQPRKASGEFTTEMSPGDNMGTRGQVRVVPLSDTDPDPDTDTDHEPPIVPLAGGQEKEGTEPEEKSPSHPTARADAILNYPLPWKIAFSQSPALEQAFLEWLANKFDSRSPLNNRLFMARRMLIKASDPRKRQHYEYKAMLSDWEAFIENASNTNLPSVAKGEESESTARLKAMIFRLATEEAAAREANGH